MSMGEKFTKKARQLPTSNSNVAHHNQIYFNPTSISVSSHQTSNYVSTDEESNETTLVEDIKIEHCDNKLNIITLNETNDANKLDDLVFNLTTNDDKQQHITGAYNETSSSMLELREPNNGMHNLYSYTRVPLTNSITNKLKKESFRRMYFCRMCPYNHAGLTYLTSHLLKHRYQPNTLKCRYCDFYETSKIKMENHEKLHKVTTKNDGKAIQQNGKQLSYK